MSRARIASGRAADERKDSGHIHPHHGGPQSVQGSGLMRVAAAGDSCLLLGGDLIVTTCQVSSCAAFTSVQLQETPACSWGSTSS